MRKTIRFLTLLALLIAAATGAWAQGAKHLITAATFDGHTRSLEQPLPYTTTIGELYEAVTGQSFNAFIDEMSHFGSLTAISSSNTSIVSIGELNGASTQVTVKDAGIAWVIIKVGGFEPTIKLSIATPLYVTMADGTADADKWKATVGTNSNAKPLPVDRLNRGDAVTLNYSGRLKVKNVTATHDGWNGDLSSIPTSALESDGMTLIVDNGTTLKGRLDVSTIPYKVVIPAGATVTLKGVTIDGNSVDDAAHRHAGITCEGDATIILADGSDNTVKGFYNSFPGIQPGPATTTLTITGEEKGTGKLTASSNGWGAGIGAGHHNDIAECGNILITGGNITAIGSINAAAIGSGDGTKCGDITITKGVTKVTATKGTQSAPYRIGPGGNGGTCGTVTIGGTVYWENNAAKSDDADAYLKQAEIVYPEPDLQATPLTIEAITAGSIIVMKPKAGMQYSLDGGKTKNAVTTDAIPVAAGDKVQFYGEDTNITGYGSYDMSECTMINGWGDGFTCKVYGNIMSLLDEKNFATATTLSGSYTFNSLFSRNRTLTDASGLLLPATQLAESCYMQMFYKCTALAAAPALPATQLQESCYREMFYGCDALTAAPVLPAKELVRLCYYAMFTRCVKLASVTCLATEGINEMNSTSDWLDGAGLAVQGTKTVNTFSTANWPEGDNGIPTDWTRVNIDN